MRKFLKSFSLFCLLVVFLAVPFVAAHAAPAHAVIAEVSAPPSFWDFVKTFESLTGVALLFAAITNAGKQFFPQYFPDNSAPTYQLIFQTIGVVTLVGLQLSGNFNLVPILDENAGVIANILTMIVGLVYQLWIARKGHENVLAGLPVIGTSYSNRRAGEPFAAELTYTEATDSSGVGTLEL